MGGGGANSGGGVERVNSEKARQQLAARKQAIKDSPLSKTPGIGGALSQAMGEFNISQQEKGLEQGGYAVAVPGTSFEAQGQRYSEQAGQTPEKFQSRISATKPAKGSGQGYVGDVAGVVKEGELFGQKTKTFTGKTGYSPSGEKIDEPKGGGGQEQTLVAQAEAEEAAPESAMAMLPGETPSQYRRRVRRFGGGTIVEGGGVLYK